MGTKIWKEIWKHLPLLPICSSLQSTKTPTLCIDLFPEHPSLEDSKESYPSDLAPREEGGDITGGPLASRLRNRYLKGSKCSWTRNRVLTCGIKDSLLVAVQRTFGHGLFHSGVVHRKALLCVLHQRAAPTQTGAKFHNTHTSWVCWSSDAILNLEKEGVLWENIPQSQCRVLFGVEGCCCSFYCYFLFWLWFWLRSCMLST